MWAICFYLGPPDPPPVTQADEYHSLNRSDGVLRVRMVWSSRYVSTVSL